MLKPKSFTLFPNSFTVANVDSLTLNYLAERRLDDLTTRYFLFKESGNEDLASLIADEGLELALALEHNKTFFCLPILEDFSSDAPLF